MSETNTGMNDFTSDGVLATPVQTVLASALAAAGSPPVVHNAAVRGAETWALVSLAILTVFVGIWVHDQYGDGFLTATEFSVLVLAPAITRVDLVLITWSNLNRALIWGELLFCKDSRETPMVRTLQAAAIFWHNGNEGVLHLDELGAHGGNAAVLMRGLSQRYAPWTAGTNPIAWVAQTAVYPVVVAVYFLMRLLSVAGFLLMASTSQLATGSRWLFNTLTGHPRDVRHLQQRNMFDTSMQLTVDKVCKLLTGHATESMLMTWEQSDIFDKAAPNIPGIGIRERALWAMLTAVDVFSRLLEYRRLFERGYPMNAGRVHARVSNGGDQGEIKRIRSVMSTRNTLFEKLDDNPNAIMGGPASKQTVYYAVVGWPKAGEFMETRANALVHAAKAWPTVFKQLELCALPGQSDLESVLVRLHDILRGWAVQATMLMWWDGLSETENALREERQQPRRELVTADAIDKMVGEMQSTQQPGVELGARLLHRTFSPDTMTSAMEGDSAIKSAMESMKPALQNWPKCACEVCITVRARGELERERERNNNPVATIEDTLCREGCRCGPSIAEVWSQYTKGYIRAIYSNNEGGGARETANSGSTQ